jgi:hypothetical protein
MGMSHVFSFEPATTDQYEEQARYECMRLVQDGRLDGPRVLSQRDDGVPWSVIRDMATPPRRSGGSTGNLRPRWSSPGNAPNGEAMASAAIGSGSVP